MILIPMIHNIHDIFLLTEPNPHSPLNVEAAQLWESDKEGILEIGGACFSTIYTPSLGQPTEV